MEEIELIAVGAILLVVATAILAGRIGVAAPLLLSVLGVGIGYLPFIPLIEVEPEIILLLVLPPLLYAAAVNLPLVDFQRNFRPIVGLSVVLVIISAVVIGMLVNLLVPVIPLPVAIALGAVVSPTDAVAATSIGKKLGMPRRLVAILEGESLVNDATSLVLLKAALAAVASSFTFWSAVGSFSYAVAAAIVIGLVVGFVTVWIRSKLANPVYDTVISFTVPFVSFIPAEHAGASGVLAVVVTGLYAGHHSATRFSAHARLNERLNWRTVQFIVENGVFLLMGLQLHGLVEEVVHSHWDLSYVVWLGLLVVVVLIALRALFAVPLLLYMRGAARRYVGRSWTLSRGADRARQGGSRSAARLERLEALQRRSEADLEHEQEQGLGWREGVALSWAGMRGVVTLAAAQSIPHDVPDRAQVVLIAFIVAITTLLLHGLTLPAIIRRLWTADAVDSGVRGLAALSADIVKAGNEALDEEIKLEQADPTRPELDPALIARVRAGGKNALASLALSPTHSASHTPGEESPAHAFVRLSTVVLQAQRDALLEERAIGRYDSEILRQVGIALDVYEARLEPPSDY